MTTEIVVLGHCTWLWWSDILWKSTWHEERFSWRILKENIGRLSLSLKLSGTRLASIKRAPRASRFSPSFLTIAPKVIIFLKICTKTYDWLGKLNTHVESYFPSIGESLLSNPVSQLCWNDLIHNRSKYISVLVGFCPIYIFRKKASRFSQSFLTIAPKVKIFLKTCTKIKQIFSQLPQKCRKVNLHDNWATEELTPRRWPSEGGPGTGQPCRKWLW